MKRTLVTATCTAACLSAVPGFSAWAQSAPAAVGSTVSPDDRELHDGLLRQLGSAFKLGDQGLDPDLRAALEAMAREHLVRMDAELYRWIAEERATTSGLTVSKLGMRISARLRNELKLWRVEAVNAENQAAWFQLLQRPEACLPWQRYESFFDLRARQLQLVAKPQRDAMVAGERELLKRWGRHRAALPEAPLQGIPEQVADRVRDLKLRGSAANLPPLVPALAARLLEGWKADEAISWDLQCLQAQWWLKLQPMGTEAQRQAAYAAFRFELAPTTIPASALEPGKDGGYPLLASSFDIGGRIKIDVKFDTQGQAVGASILSRDIQVPGIRDNPPLNFVTVFDKLAISRALQQKFPVPAKAEIKDGFWHAQQEFSFHIKD
jgi:hypothetical protein